ncbi:hypothetical protein ACFHW2_07295 [Actinomadura sp. LOL_016]|uniref:hypothetical protein n=1 Tax=unclassified Actinomadura TaxID=2626254 RepID=UPI003A8056E7
MIAVEFALRHPLWTAAVVAHEPPYLGLHGPAFAERLHAVFSSHPHGSSLIQ